MKRYVAYFLCAIGVLLISLLFYSAAGQVSPKGYTPESFYTNMYRFVAVSVCSVLFFILCIVSAVKSKSSNWLRPLLLLLSVFAVLGVSAIDILLLLFLTA